MNNPRTSRGRPAYSFDRFDLEAMAEAQAIWKARETTVAHPMTRAQARRGIVRGKIGADSRRGMVHAR